MAREGKAELLRRTRRILRRLHEDYPNAHCELDFQSPLQLLVATILSAQCTDVMVNRVTPALFRKYRTARDFASAPPGELESMIRQTGFFNNKAKSIRGACRKIVEEFGCEVPGTMDGLLRLPGIARKSANVILGTVFGKAEGVVVDTHVQRLSKRLSLSRGKNPVQIERDLMEIVPRDEWIFFGHGIVWHGRRVCKAKKPERPRCSIRKLCPFPLKTESSATFSRSST